MINLQDIKAEINKSAEDAIAKLDAIIDSAEQSKAVILVNQERQLAQITEVETVIDAVIGPIGQLKGV